MIKTWLSNMLRKDPVKSPEVEYEEITIHLAKPIPPAGSGVILNNRDWKRAVERQRQLEAAK